jgi:hypothetical membrane protein
MTHADDTLTAPRTRAVGDAPAPRDRLLDWVQARRMSGVLLFVLAAQFMTVIMLAASMAPGYDFNAAAISDLGVIAETALLFNVSLVVVGVLNITAAVALFRSTGRRSLLVLSVLAGIGAIGAGLFPLDVSELHGIFALLAFVFFNLQAILSATEVRGTIRVISLAAGITGLVFVVLMVLGDSGNAAAFGPIGHGGTERMIVYPVMLWMLAFGGFLMGERER